jgi:hypothetical protein
VNFSIFLKLVLRSNIQLKNGKKVTFWIFAEDKHSFIKSVTPLKLNTWIHVAVVLKGNLASIYFNGILETSGEVFKPRNIVRTSNFIGKSNWGHDAHVDASFDEIKIFNRALYIEEIIDEAKSSNISFNYLRNDIQLNQNGLINYWKFNGNMFLDEINGDELSDANNVHLANDRFGNEKYAIILENGYLELGAQVLIFFNI